MLCLPYNMRRLVGLIIAFSADIMTYIYEKPEWPALRWDRHGMVEKLAAVRYRQGLLLGRMNDLGFKLSNEAMLRTLTQDAIKSSEIEGTILDGDQVRSSIARRLGNNIGALSHADRAVEGMVEMTLDATRHFDRPLTAERLFGWHAALFPTGYAEMRKIVVGMWRDDRSGPMQVVSASSGRERVHYQAPDAGQVDSEMVAFLAWFSRKPEIDPVLRAAIAHLRFVTVYPFEDGNGRIARAITDMALARSEGSGRRFYSMSAQIRLERRAYYEILERTQKGDLDISLWLDWFLGCLDRAFDGAEELLTSVLRKARFWRENAQGTFNPRQRDMLNRLLDGFEGKVTSSKWARIEKCSPDTALRDISELIRQGILQKAPSGGRSTNYLLVLQEKRFTPER